MVVLGEGAVSYERNTPATERVQRARRLLARGGVKVQDVGLRI
jgi:hypothetical protein